MPCVAGSRSNRTTRLSGRRSQTRRAGRICANLGVSRLARSAATRGDGPLDLVTNTPRQNGPDLSPDALARLSHDGMAVIALARDRPAIREAGLEQRTLPTVAVSSPWLFGRIFSNTSRSLFAR